VLYSLLHRQPVQVVEDWGDVIRLLGERYNPGSSILNSLEPLQLGLGETPQAAVAVVQPGLDEGYCYRVSSGLVQEGSKLSE
jgi:hypothetical protein